MVRVGYYRSFVVDKMTVIESGGTMAGGISGLLFGGCYPFSCFWFYFSSPFSQFIFPGKKKAVFGEPEEE